MKDILLNRNLLNSNKIFFHYGAMIEQIAKGKKYFSPVAIEIHPTAKCNHKCVHCYYKERNESRASISASVMDKLVNSIIKYGGVKAVYFSGGGEPTLYPNLKHYIEKLTDSDIEVAIITNGSFFEQAGLIPIAHKMNYIAVSLPGVDDDTFETIVGAKTNKKFAW